MKRNKMYHLIFIIVLISCNDLEEAIDASAILNKSIAAHDKNNNWNTTSIEIQIQEPRISNPKRYSILKLNNRSGTFELSRNREGHIVKYSINEKGENSVLLDDNEVIDSLVIKKYGLDTSRNSNYRRFYSMMYGLPMSIPEYLKTINDGGEVIFNKEACYKIVIELKEPIITKFWNVYISKKSNYVVGVEIFHEDDKEKGERMYFENLIEINEMKLPRIRHWLDLKNNDYGGSDIIIKEIN
ncbi:DUF6503 family protein [Aquimarina algiphila]|uniref:DUF6503 family protein n=1 Tax=Aquimarina algiphila TaxID=2047982 RepID=UPI00232C6B5D|nr:DUF6503 family protein [Aquimarina algiphila]